MDGVKSSQKASQPKLNPKKLNRNANVKLAKETYEVESRRYFESITELPALFLEVRKIVGQCVFLDIRNLIVLQIYKTFRLEKWIQLHIVPTDNENHDNNSSSPKTLLLRLNCSDFPLYFEKLFKTENVSIPCKNEKHSGNRRKHPSVTVTDKKVTICGLSSVLRFVLKYICYQIEKSVSSNNDTTDEEILSKLKQFLGFRYGCLQACAESSIWTRFCEVDMISSVNDIPIIAANLLEEKYSQFTISEHLMKYERHLSLPVKIHNFRRVIQDIKKAEGSHDITEGLSKAFDEKVLISSLKHDFAEGPTLLLSDLILYPSVHAYILFYGEENFKRLLPISFEWYKRLDNFYKSSTETEANFVISHDFQNVIEGKSEAKINWIIPEVPAQSLYTSDPKRYKPTLRQFTRQPEIDESLEFLKNKYIVPLRVNEKDPAFKWDEIPVLAHPEGGNLPLSRRSRKCDQLANLVVYALEVYSATAKQKGKSRFRIVDFCSGGGHVGILVAYLLPNCDVTLVENKDESLRRAQERVSGLGLSNVFFYQSNLDYFDSEFDLGLALHACGTATDLVIAKCVGVNASFVCCPCCYGAVQENHILSYPMSSVFRQSEISLRQYFVLCHSSDHTHDETHAKTSQGKECMALIDTDRCLYGADRGYDVKLCKMVPETASPKNHILVGVSPS